MKGRTHRSALAVAAVAAAAVFMFVAQSASAVALGTSFTYQGSLDKLGLGVTSTCNFTFKLYDALTAGTQIGGTLSPAVTLTENGQFSVQLDFGAGIFDGNQRFLEVAVQCPGDVGFTTLAPRQPITATPYALYALTGAGGGGGFVLPYFGPVTSTIQDAFRIQNNATTGSFFAIRGASATTASNAGGVLGEATATTGSVVGTYGVATASPTGTGAVGKGGATGGWFESMATTGDGTGLWGVSHTDLNTAGGVKGVNYSTTGSTVGTWGIATASPTGTGVAGQGSAVGGYFQSNSVTGGSDFAGVYGVANAYPGVKGVSSNAAGVRGEGLIGVQGIASSAFSIAVAGSGTTGLPTVSGQNQGSGDGVSGSSTGGNGVSGLAYSASAYGGWFQNAAVGGVALHVEGPAQVKTLQILGADVAEAFPSRSGTVEPGSVLEIAGDRDGGLRVCRDAYSHRVAGVASGANHLPAGVVLAGKSYDGTGTVAVALTGRVWVKCDATETPIRVGDLLTTSARAGHAMTAVDPARSSGAILGKAMTALESGTGFVLVLVSLQ